MLVAGRIGFISKLQLVISLDKQTAVRISYAPRYRTLFLLLSSGQLFLRGIVSALFGWCQRLTIVVKRLLSVSLSICIYLFHPFLLHSVWMQQSSEPSPAS